MPYHRSAAGFFVWADVRGTGLGADVFTEVLWEHAQVAITPGPMFGRRGDGWVRILFSAPVGALEEGFTRIGTLYRYLASGAAPLLMSSDARELTKRS